MGATTELPRTVRLAEGSVVVRQLGPKDDLSELTQLLHRAYAELASRGLKFVASHQDAVKTRKRIEGGTCLVGAHGTRLVATVTWHEPGVRLPDAPPAWYERPEVGRVNQFAVEPALQGRGLGGLLMDLVEAQASQNGIAELALDTADGAVELKAWYEARGYRQVGQHQWPDTNYKSVILSKKL